MKLIAVVTTVEKAEDARRLSRDAVESRLAACAQLEPIESTYFWDGALEDAREIRITFKTRAGLWPEPAPGPGMNRSGYGQSPMRRASSSSCVAPLGEPGIPRASTARS